METCLRECLHNSEINPCPHLIAQLGGLEDQCNRRNTGLVVGRQGVESRSVIYQLYDPGEVISTSSIHSFIIWLSEYY